MKTELTPEQVTEMGKMWGDVFLSTLSPEERLAGLRPEERLAGLRPEERLAGLSAEEIEKYLRKLKKRQRRKENELTPEQITATGKMWGTRLVRRFSIC